MSANLDIGSPSPRDDLYSDVPEVVRRALAHAGELGVQPDDGWRAALARLKRRRWLTGGLIVLMTVILWTTVIATAPILRSSATVEIDGHALKALLAEAAPAFTQEPSTPAEIVAWLDETVRPALAMTAGEDAISVVGVDRRVIITGQSRDPDQAAAYANDAAKRTLAFLDGRKTDLRQDFAAFAEERKTTSEDEPAKAAGPASAPVAATTYEVTPIDAGELRLLKHFTQALDDEQRGLQERMTALSDRPVAPGTSAQASPAATREQELDALRKNYLAAVIDLGRLRDVLRVERSEALAVSTPSGMPQMSPGNDLATALDSETWQAPWARITRPAPVPAVPLMRRPPVVIPAVLALGLVLGLVTALLATLLIKDEDDAALGESEEVFENPHWPIV